MPAPDAFAPPANVPLSPAADAAWQRFMDTEVWGPKLAGAAALAGVTALPRVVSPATPGAGEPQHLAVTWGAFPESMRFAVSGITDDNKSEIAGFLGPFDLADSQQLVVGSDRHWRPAPPGMFSGRYLQDEYLEWRDIRDQRGLVAVEFTCEPPELWQEFFEADREGCAKAQSEILKADVKAEHLELASDLAVREVGENGKVEIALIGLKGEYNRRNRWNTTDGLVHLTQASNTLKAEVALAVQATIDWTRDDNQQWRDQQQLCEWTRIGEPARDSDPSIAWAVFQAANNGPPVVASLTPPVGLYIADWTESRLHHPDGLDGWWNAIRSTTDIEVTNDDVRRTFKRVVRLRVGPPPGDPRILEDCTVDDLPVTHGGQLAEVLTMALFVDAWAAPDVEASPLKVVTKPRPGRRLLQSLHDASAANAVALATGSGTLEARPAAAVDDSEIAVGKPRPSQRRGR